MPCAQRFDNSHHLPLVIDGSARDHALAARAVDDRRFKRRTGPQLDWIDGLHVVVSVVENPRTLRGVITDSRMMRDHHRMADGLASLRVIAKPTQLLHQPFRRATRVLVIRGIGTNAWNPQEIAQSRG